MSNYTGNTAGCQPQPINDFIAIFLSFIYFIGFVLNCISLWIFWFKVKPWNSMVVLQFNLAISDAIITPAAPLIVMYYLTDNWTYGLFLCRFKVFLLSTNMYGSIYFLTIISIHRYFTIAHNLKRLVLGRKPFITKLCLFIWGCLLCQGIPFFFVLKTTKVQNITKCLSFHKNDEPHLFFAWNWVILFTGLLIPFSITLVCYSLLIKYMRKVSPMNTLSTVMVSKSVRTITISLIIFIICYIPIHITRTLGVTIMLFFPDFCSLLRSVEAAHYFTWMLSGTNCCLDPLLYCFASRRFKCTLTSWCTSLKRQNQNITEESQNNQLEGLSDTNCSGPFQIPNTT
ncbi:PREDICTED: P2Y purinoceptor 4-like [Nanorana parkeri]|uniref:P2Y purinoceptor 4-like n=1 Tax=Nanorana parkeri TaxID=125878 RepID=UPI000854A549|nr:PREDICTED: P2Y purinoceptor 4-like [Nanorana parkeri]